VERRGCPGRCRLSIERYLRARQIELAQSLRGRAKVYLDLNFWITLRETAAERRSGSAERKLLHLLRRGVHQGAIVCPISDTFFFELLKQPYSEDRRIGTAKLVDELSLGVTLANSFVRTGTEICAFLWGATKEVELHQIEDLAWTKLGYVLGELYPEIAGLGTSINEGLQRRFVDLMWDCSLTELIRTAGEEGFPPDDPYRALSARTNTERDRFAYEITSFERAYEIEIRGALDALGDTAMDIMVEWGRRQNTPAPSPGSPEWTMARNMIMNMLAAALEKTDAKKALRTLHIEASLHAALRWDKPRRFKANDFYDFRHAAAALGYCDAFFTDGPLRDLINGPRLGLSDLHDCRIASDLDGAVEIVRTLTG
jgi:hypothetical protein